MFHTGGLLAGSLAIMTDAAHMLSDFAAFLISLFAIWVAHWLPDKKRTFGYYRAGILKFIYILCLAKNSCFSSLCTAGMFCAEEHLHLSGRNCILMT